MQDKMYNLLVGNNLDLLKDFSDNSLDACITDPPYGMGMDSWDHSVPPKETWQEVFRVLKPGAFCLSFCSPELYHRMAVNLEDGGFRIVDQIMWMTTTKMAKQNRLKPAHEPIAVGQKPVEGSIKKNVEKWGVGQINTDTTRVPWDKNPPKGWVANGHSRRQFGRDGNTQGTQKDNGTVDADPRGRYPMNIIGEVESEHQKYFYAPRASRAERGEFNDHPTPKPIDLMRYLVEIYCPKGGIVLDPFCGSGSTGIGALLNGCEFVGIDLSEHYIEISRRRLESRTQYELTDEENPANLLKSQTK